MFDVIVLGLGAMGSAAAMHLARRGARVLGLERFGPAHDQGSAHGESRLIRKAYFESPAYVPLLERSYALWDALSADAGTPLLHRAGLVLFGKRAAAASEVARAHGVAVEHLSPSQARARFPALRIDDELEALFEPGAGWLEVERCVRAHLDAARAASADLRFDEPALAWRADGASGQIEVETHRGRHRAGRLVVAAGAWAPALLADLGLPLQVHRVVQMWFDASPAHDAPCFGFDVGGGFFYGFPRVGGRVKVADHMARQAISRPEDVRREIDAADTRHVEAFVRKHLPHLRTPPVQAKTCLYTMTPDEHFLVDVHPDHPQVALAAGFSGHGFKFSPVIGEMLADLALEGRTREDAAFLRLRGTRRDRGSPAG
ncbi:MAG TPA: N-methyl-L-tryptophan oxidase [Polyangiaceae bacterium]